jgi:2-keto-4-pentenoate hydratase
LGEDRPKDRLIFSMDAEATARIVLKAIDGGQIEPFTTQDTGFSEADASAVTAKLRELRIERGEKPVGRKIGFTNRNIWAEYGVYQPIWGDMYDTTVRDVALGAWVEVSQLPEPRIEPEIVLGLGGDLSPDMGFAEIAQAVSWVAHGFEFVQSIFPAWRFQVADCIADGGLHGRLFIGPRRKLSDKERGTLTSDLARLKIRLNKNGDLADTGSGTNVLDGPIQALAHLVAVLGKDKLNPPLRAGEIVTTGTLTRALPVLSGERWSTEISGYGLPGLSVEIA